MRMASVIARMPAEFSRGCAEKRISGLSKTLAQTEATRRMMPAWARMAVPEYVQIRGFLRVYTASNSYLERDFGRGGALPSVMRLPDVQAAAPPLRRLPRRWPDLGFRLLKPWSSRYLDIFCCRCKGNGRREKRPSWRGRGEPVHCYLSCL